MEHKSIAIYLKEDKIYISPRDRSRVGLSFMKETVFISHLGEVELLKNNILEALKICRLDESISSMQSLQDIAKKNMKTFLKQVGYSSVTAFNKDAKCLSFETENLFTKISPSNNKGRGGFLTVAQHISTEIHQSVENLEAQELYDAIIEAFSRCNIDKK